MSSPEALALLATLRLEDGRRWGEVALPWQLDDVQALIDRDGPRRHWWSRARGMSKTSDAAAAMLALLLAEAPPLARAYAFASDRDQAGLVLDALAGFVARGGPALADVVELGSRSVTVRATGAKLVVESADAASSFGLRPWATVVDEAAQWPSTAGHRRLWSAIVWPRRRSPAPGCWCARRRGPRATGPTRCTRAPASLSSGGSRPRPDPRPGGRQRTSMP